jgi:hypothetical protein
MILFNFKELDKKRDTAIYKKKKAQLVWKYGGGEEEDTIDYVLFTIRDLRGIVLKYKIE